MKFVYTLNKSWDFKVINAVYPEDQITRWFQRSRLNIEQEPATKIQTTYQEDPAQETATAILDRKRKMIERDMWLYLMTGDKVKSYWVQWDSFRFEDDVLKRVVEVQDGISTILVTNIRWNMVPEVLLFTSGEICG